MIKSLFKPKEEKRRLSRKTAFFRILFIILLLGAGYLVNKVHVGQKSTDSQVLGSMIQAAAAPVPTSVPIRDLVEGTVQDVKNSFTSAAEQTLDAAVDSTKNAATDIIIETTATTVISQIEKMPQDEQKKIKEIICR